MGIVPCDMELKDAKFQFSANERAMYDFKFEIPAIYMCGIEAEKYLAGVVNSSFLAENITRPEYVEMYREMGRARAEEEKSLFLGGGTQE